MEKEPKQEIEEVIVIEETISSQDKPNSNENKLSIPVAIIVVGVLIAGAILLSGNRTPGPVNIPVDNNSGTVANSLAPVGKDDRVLGNSNAKLALIMYEDFQCPYCGAISGFMPNNAPLMLALRGQDPNWTPFTPEIINNYVKNGDVLFVYRDFAFLGSESTRAAEAARCAEDQGKFWEYHDYLYGRQNGENQGTFSDQNLKSFAVNLGLNATAFNQCLDSGKHAQEVADSKIEATNAGVNGTPKGYILKDGKIVNTIEGAEPLSTVKPKIEAALK